MAEFAEYVQRHSQISQFYTQNGCSDFLLDSNFIQPHIIINNNNQPPSLHNYANFDPDNQQKLELQSTHTSPSASSISTTTSNINNCGRGNKKGKNKETDKLVEKSGLEQQVVHVRAKRGQATDSHSIAERLRREKINNKLKCLQEIVPGCHKSMGMAVMLEEIINYVHSLQNQVEFLSMELAAAASSSYEFKVEKETSEKAQVTTQETFETQKWLRERYAGGGMNSYESTWSI